MLNPKEIILGVRDYLNDLGPHSEEPLLGKYNSQEAAFQCTTCGACEFQCPVGIEHLPVIIGLRRGAVNTGAWEDDHGTKLFLALERSGNALGMSATERDKFIKKQELPIFDGSQEYCLWLGCMGAYDPQGREIIASFAKVMDYLGTSYRGSQEREVHRRSRPPSRQRSRLPAARRAEPGDHEAAEGHEDRHHLPALRPHHRQGLDGLRRLTRDRASQ